MSKWEIRRHTIQRRVGIRGGTLQAKVLVFSGSAILLLGEPQVHSEVMPPGFTGCLFAIGAVLALIGSFTEHDRIIFWLLQIPLWMRMFSIGSAAAEALIDGDGPMLWNLYVGDLLLNLGISLTLVAVSGVMDERGSRERMDSGA